jgi:glycosyltransferase involved in cell wall biosynthesis
MAAWRRRAASWLGPSREHQQAIEKASAIISITAQDAEAASIIFRIPRNCIQLIPVAVSDYYFHATSKLWNNQYGAEPFVLCVGAIQQRKNQLLLARICNQLRLPLVLVGAVLPGEDAYAAQVKIAMAANEKLGGRWLRCSDAVLASAYAACRVLVLLSASETQPASVLQAMALEKPVLLAAVPYAHAYPFAALPRVNLREDLEVERALHRIWHDAPKTQLPDEFRWPSVCSRLALVYDSILRKVDSD